jgi:hypothetical protein
MKAPKDVNAVSVTISTNGAVKHSFIGRVTPQGQVLLPATLAIVEPDDASASIRIRVMAFQDRKPRVLRDVRTTVPSKGRTALLRIPLNFVNDGSTKSAPLPDGVLPDPVPGTGGTTSGGGNLPSTSSSGGDFDFLSSFQPDCPDFENQTWIDGACKDNYVDSSALPDFDADLVGNSANPGSCFDVAKCFGSASLVGDTTPVPRADAGTVDGSDGGAVVDGGAASPPSGVTLDRSTCTLQLNGADPARLNLAIVTPDTGECVRPNECYVPIDRGSSGWEDVNGKVQLPSFVCTLLGSKGLRLATSTGACAAKEEKNAICAAAGGVGVDPGTSAPVLVAEVSYPSTVAESNGVLYFAGDDGLSALDLAAPAAPVEVVQGPVAGHKPWRLDPAQSGVRLVDGTATAYIVINWNLHATPLTVAAGTVAGTSLNNGAYGTYAWAVGGRSAVDPATLGIYLTAIDGSTSHVALTELGANPPKPLSFTPTALLSGSSTSMNGVMVGDTTGSIRWCSLGAAQIIPQNSCGLATVAAQGQVDAILGKPNVPNAGYALMPDGVYRSTIVSEVTGQIQVALARKSNVAGITDSTGTYYPRSAAVNAQCFFFTGADGLSWGNDSGAGGIIVPAGASTLLGAALGPSSGQVGGLDALYYTVFAPIKKGDPSGGGVYRVPLPAQCNGSAVGGGGGSSGSGGTSDSGTGGGSSGSSGTSGSSGSSGSSGTSGASGGIGGSDAAVAVCSPATCNMGCCSFAGACTTGLANNSCGANGAPCAVCPTACTPGLNGGICN